MLATACSKLTFLAPCLGSDASSVWNFVRSFLRRHLAGKPEAIERMDYFVLVFKWLI